MGDWAELTLQAAGRFTLKVQGGELGSLETTHGQATVSGQKVDLTSVFDWFPSTFRAGVWENRFVLVPEANTRAWCRGEVFGAPFAVFRRSEQGTKEAPRTHPPLCAPAE